jgi:hypothetical protein
MIHRIFGVVTVLIWLWLICHLHSWFPGLELAASSGVGRAGSGFIYVMLMPLLAVALLVFPDFFADRFSPLSVMTGEPLLGAGFWQLCGYFVLLVSWGLFEVFRG